MAKSKTPISKKTTEPSVVVPNTVLSLTFPWKQVEPEYQKVLKRLAKQLHIQGFRKGMVPTHIAEQQLKSEAIIEPVLQALLPEAYTNLLKKEEKKPIADPEFVPKTVEKGADWVVEVQIAEKPVVDVSEYLKIAKNAKKEALVHIAAEAKKKDQPKDKKVSAEAEKQHQEDHILQHMFQDFVQTIKPAIPELLVKQQTRRELERLVQELRSMKLTLDDFLQRNNQTFEQLTGSIATRALGQLQLEFILQTITEKLGLTVDQAEIDALFAKTADEKHRREQQNDVRYQDAARVHLTRKKLFDHLLEAK